MWTAVLIAVMTGVLVTGAEDTGKLIGKGLGKAVVAIHHHVTKPVGQAAKAIAKHQVSKK